MLWLCLRFPCLALEVFPPTEGPAVAVLHQQVVCANASACGDGIQSGMGLAAALGLVPHLLIRDGQPEREAELLHTLACWAEGFTPLVSLAPPDELLLEIGGCLRLFGGLDALRARVADGLASQGLSVIQSAAPTPLAAQWLARVGDETACLQPADLPTQLASLPVEVIDGLDGKRLRTLASLGVTCLGDLFALPASGLHRRFGSSLPRRLAQALGETPDLRLPFIFPERFAQRLELPAKVADAGMLQFAARRLLAALAGWLAARAAGVLECVFQLEHEDGEPVSTLRLAFAEATADPERLERVLRERLQHYRLIAPTWRIELLADTPLPLAGRSLGLFGQEAALALAPVIERLRARLGADAVHGVAAVAEYRPECASRNVAQGHKAEAPRLAGPRPLWLLPAPLALGERNGVPQRNGDLLRLAGPERIESGWWDGGQGTGDVCRDYYIACTPRGEWLWVYRDATGWWQQGVFA
jgi:protein ImuB